jgi:hypothetical protein
VASSVFIGSVQFTSSSTFTSSARFSASASFNVPLIAGQNSNSLGAGAAAGIGVGGLAAIGALLLLLFLIKRRKRMDPNEPNETGGESTAETMTENEAYISEYGLSDGVRPMNDEEIREDLPQVVGDDGQYGSEIENASEHNPEDLDEGLGDPDEG